MSSKKLKKRVGKSNKSEKKIKHLLSLQDLSPKELKDIIALAIKIKKNPKGYARELQGKQIVMLFEKPSLRTRLSFELGIEQMGGDAVFYSKEHSTIGHKETWADFAKVVSSFNDHGIICRLFEHADIKEIAQASQVPVINALTNSYHPMQIIADFMTIFEQKKKFNVKIAFVGDCKNNVTHSLMEGAMLLGATIHLSFPKGYGPFLEVYEATKEHVQIFKTPKEAVKDADFVYTDSWMSYQIPSKEKKKRMKDLKAYQINRKLLESAPNALVMHCLPATRGMEITEDVLDGKQSIVFEQAENRLHSTKAVMLMLL